MIKILSISLAIIVIALVLILSQNQALVAVSSLSPQPTVLTNRPVKTNSWLSGLYSFPSYPVFAYPGVFQIDEKGIHTGIPNVNAVEKTVYGSFIPQCLISFGSQIEKSVVYSYSDWGVTMHLSGKDFSSAVHIIQGSPFVYITEGGRVTFDCPPEFSSRYEFQSFGEGKYRLTILPVEKDFIKETLTSLPWDPIIDTQMMHSQKADEIKTTLHYLTASGGETAVAMMPHQVSETTAKIQVLGHYQTALGSMNLSLAKSIELTSSVPNLPFSFRVVTDSKQKSEIIAAILSDTSSLLKEGTPPGVYFRGTYLGALTTLSQLADVYGMKDEKDRVLVRLEEVLHQELDVVNYDQQKTMLVATNTEFGHEFGNDHHFHWGYYIRAAAILGTYKPETITWMSPKINEMISDIAESDRLSTKYPYLRSYSPYDGHSWADGRGQFADGNNQESTSEALNAWYAVSLWGHLIKNTTVENLGNWLFSQELSGTKSYWFGYENPFPSGYGHPMSSLVWGGKRDFATWFSGQPMHIYGIQFLPITPASVYLKKLPNANANIADMNKSGDAASHEWGDLFVSYVSFSNPNQSISLLGDVKSSSGMKLKSLLLQTVYANSSVK